MSQIQWAEAAADILRAGGYPVPARAACPAPPRTPPGEPFLWLETRAVRLLPLGLGQDTLLRADVTLGLRVYTPQADQCLPLFGEAARLLRGTVSACGAPVFADGCWQLDGTAALSLWTDRAELPQAPPDMLLDWKGRLSWDAQGGGADII